MLLAGLPMVAEDVGQVAEYITHGHNGRLVAPGDTVGAARELVTLVTDPARRARTGINARASILSEHTWAHRIDDIEAAVTGRLTGHTSR